MENKFDLKKFLAENKKGVLNEGTVLYNKKGMEFKRFAGPNGVAMQITTPKLKDGGVDYIQIDGSRLGEFISALADSIRKFDNMSTQDSVDEGADDWGDMYSKDKYGNEYIDIEDHAGKGRKPDPKGDPILVNGKLYRVTDEESISGEHYRIVPV